MAGETKVSLMTYLGTVPDDAKIYVVKPGDTKPYYTTKAALLSGIAGGSTPGINAVLTVDDTVTNQDQIFELSPTKYIKINRAAQKIEIWDNTVLTGGPCASIDANGFQIAKNAGALGFGITPESIYQAIGSDFWYVEAGVIFCQIGSDSYQIDVNGLTINGSLYSWPSGASSPLATQDYVDTEISAASVGKLDDRGNYDASPNLFPSSGGSGTAGAVLKGDLWTVSVAGTLGGVSVSVGDVIRALTDAPGQTSANWNITENNLGYVPENNANKTSTVVGNETSTSLFLTIKGYYDYLIGMTWLADTIFGTWINARTAKTTPVDADMVVLMDSADTNKAKKLSWANIKATLKTYFDTLYGVKSDYIKLTAARTLASTTSLQSLFGLVYNASANRTIRFRVEFDLVSLSSTSGNFSFGLLGTAGIANFNYKSNAVKTNSLDAVNADNFVSGQVTTAVVISNTGTQTNGKAFITGTIVTSTAGTIDLAIATSIATGAAQVTNVSFADFKDIGPDTLSQTSNIS